MSDKDDKIEGYVPSTFTDAGTGETFEGGKKHKFTAGAHRNYSFAGLIGEESEAERKASASPIPTPTPPATPAKG
jgi:hypothetical protein